VIVFLIKSFFKKEFCGSLIGKPKFCLRIMDGKDLRRILKSKIVLSVLKFVVVGLLLAWMVSSGRLDFSRLSLIVGRVDLFALNLAYWLICPVFLSAFRWSILMAGLGITVRFSRVAFLQVIGMAFNSAMPGAVGGDLFKAYYVLRESHGQKKASRTGVVLSIFNDRLAGIFGLFSVGFLAGLINLDFVRAHEATWNFFLMISGVFFVTLVGVVAVLIPVRPERDVFRWLWQMPVPGARIVERVISSLRMYRHHLGSLIGAWLISAAVQFCGALYFWWLCEAIEPNAVSLVKLLVIFPLGLLVTALPISPGGLGVGHMAFDTLFHAIDVDGGANFFNVFFIGQMMLNLSGFIAYLFLRRKEPAPVDLEAVADS
jgi:glycosyltransferase 2 family protein